MENSTNRDLRKRLRSGKNIVVQRSLLAEGKQLFLIAFSYLLVHVISYSVPALQQGLELGTVMGRQLGVLFSPIEFIPIALFLWMVRCVLDERYVIQPKSVLKIKGFMSLGFSTMELYYDTIRTIQVEQSFYQQLFNLDNVRIGSMFAKGGDIVMSGVRNPYQYKTLIERHMQKPAPMKAGRRLRPGITRPRAARIRALMGQTQ